MKFEVGQIVKHVKTGGIYHIIGAPKDNYRLEHNNQPAYLYQRWKMGDSFYWYQVIRRLNMSNLSIENILKFVNDKNEAIVDFKKDKESAERAVNEFYALLENNKQIIPSGKLLLEFRDTHLTTDEINQKILVIRQNNSKLGLRSVMRTESLSFNLKKPKKE